MSKSKEIKPYFPVFTRITKLRVDKSRVKHVRMLTFVCKPYELLNNSYFFPKKESLKYVRKVSMHFSSNTGDVMDKILRYFKHTKPENFYFSTESIFKLIEKIGILRHFDFFSNLASLGIRIENSLIDAKAASFFGDWVYKSLNVKNLMVSIERGSAVEDSIVFLFSILGCLTKVQNFVLKAPYSSVSDSELQALAEFSIPFMEKLTHLIIETRGNKNVSDIGLISLAKALEPKLHINSFELDVRNTPVGVEGLERLLSSFENNHDIASFTLKVEEVSEIDRLLVEFFNKHQNLKTLKLDFNSSSKIDEEILRNIQEKVAALPSLESYDLNVSGCHALKAGGTYYLPESLGLFTRLRELKIHFANFLEQKSGDKCAESLDKNIPKLTNLEKLFLDFNGCTEWFVETKGNSIFFEKLKDLQKLKSLYLNLRKTTITSNHIAKFQQAVTQLKNLVSLELDISFCKFLDDKDMKSIMIILPSVLPLQELAISADDIKYAHSMLLQDLQNMIKSSKALRRATIMMKNNFNKKEGLFLMSSIEKIFPYFNLHLIGGRTFTSLKPQSMTGQVGGIRKSRFGSSQGTVG
jgi:hypothetical protein